MEREKIRPRMRLLFSTRSDTTELERGEGEGAWVGFDVLDGGTSHVREALDARHALERLNRYGLFEQHSDAAAFAKRFGRRTAVWSVFWMSSVPYGTPPSLTLAELALEERPAPSVADPAPFWAAALDARASSADLELPGNRWIHLEFTWDRAKLRSVGARGFVTAVDLARYAAELRAVLDRPEACELRELSVVLAESNTYGDHDLLEHDGLVEALAARPVPSLESLAVGCIDAPYDTVVRSVADVWSAAPALRTLTLGGEFTEDPGPIRSRTLERLYVNGLGLSPATLERVVNAEAPELTELMVRLSNGVFSSRAELSVLEPLYNGERFPKLTSLSALTAPSGGEAHSELLASPMARRLTSLNLSYSDFLSRVEGLLVLAEHAHFVSTHAGVCVISERPYEVVAPGDWSVELRYRDGTELRGSLDSFDE